MTSTWYAASSLVGSFFIYISWPRLLLTHRRCKYFVYLLWERLVGLECRLLLGDVYNQKSHDVARVYCGIFCDLHPLFFNFFFLLLS